MKNLSNAPAPSTSWLQEALLMGHPGPFQGASLHHRDLLELSYVLCPSHPPLPHPLLELPPLCPWPLLPDFIHPSSSVPPTHWPFSAYKQVHCSLTNLHKLLRWHINPLLYMLSNFFAVCFNFGYGVLIPQNLQFSLDFI